MIDFAATLLDPLYATLGVEANLTVGSTVFTPTVIDKTDGVNVGDHVEVPTILPAAAIRRAELTGLGLNKDDLIDATISFNGFTFTISNVKPKANPSGELSGELYLVLVNPTELASSES